MIKFQSRPAVEINSSSMADIAFLLLIFFLVTTTISMDKGLDIVLPSGDSEIKVNKKNITIITINEAGKVLYSGHVEKQKSLDSNNMHELESLARGELLANKEMIFSVQFNSKTKFEDYMRVVDYLKLAEARKISIAE